jgi:hypothetical protein
MPAERPRRKEVREWRVERVCFVLDSVGYEWVRMGRVVWRGTYPVIMLHRLWDERVYEEGEFFFCWRHVVL